MHNEKMTTRLAAYRLGVCVGTIRRAIKQGMLTGVYGGLNGRRLVGVTAESVNRLLAAREEANAAQGAGGVA